jgi:Rieske Fe-S protein
MVHSFLLLWLLGAAWVVASFVAPPRHSLRAADWQLDAGPVESYEINAPRMIQRGREPVWVGRRNARDFLALVAVCPYQHCVLRWDPTLEVFTCPCHQETYGLDGRVASDRDRRPLLSFFVNVKADRVRVHLRRTVEAES